MFMARNAAASRSGGVRACSGCGKLHRSRSLHSLPIVITLIESKPMKFAETRVYADPEKAARKLVEIANTIEPVQDGRIHIEKINAPFLYRERGTPAEYGAGLDLAIERGWLWMHESRTYVKLPGSDAATLA
jgi:hypothetical protein